MFFLKCQKTTNKTHPQNLSWCDKFLNDCDITESFYLSWLSLRLHLFWTICRHIKAGHSGSACSLFTLSNHGSVSIFSPCSCMVFCSLRTCISGVLAACYIPVSPTWHPILSKADAESLASGFDKQQSKMGAFWWLLEHMCISSGLFSVFGGQG